ncbi:MAG: DUF3999 domain-containing protein [Gemmataceae bacterium]|nr:DUF3999 domain-containing protein [Gemmataceae bacterium]
MRWSSAVYLAMGLLAAPGAARAQDGPDLARWEWFQEVLLPVKSEGRTFAFTLPPSVLGKAKLDLSALRLADAQGNLVPHALRVLHARYEQTPVPVRQRFDEGADEKKRYMQVRLDLKAEGEVKHNNIEVETSGHNFRRRVEVLGSDRADFQEALKVADGYLLTWEVDDWAGGRSVSFRRLRYEPKSYRYLQVRVYPDGDEELPKIGQVTVRHVVVVKGKDVTLPAALGPRQAVRGEGGPGSAWFIELGERVPVYRLTFEGEPKDVDRPFRLEVANPDEPRLEILGGEWRWWTVGERRLLEINFPEVTARRLRLIVTDFANPPLELRSVQYSAPVRQVVFADQGQARPVRLYYGNPEAEAPRYDAERALLAVRSPEEVQLGERTVNPAYEPPPKPLAERAPWVVYVALGAAALALLAMLGLLARQTLVRHDSAQLAASAARPESS